LTSQLWRARSGIREGIGGAYEQDGYELRSHCDSGHFQPGFDQTSSPSLGTSQGADADLARTRTTLAAYKDFLTLWKDANPDIPILKDAKAEYAKLQ